MVREELVARLHGYVASELLDGDADELDEHTPLLEWGVIDSMSMVSILGFIDEELGIRVPDEHVRPEHFASIGALADLLVAISGQRSVA